MPWPKGKPRDAETKRKIACGKRGQKLSEETRKKISLSNKRHCADPTVRKKMSRARKRFWADPEYRKMMWRASARGMSKEEILDYARQWIHRWSRGIRPKNRQEYHEMNQAWVAYVFGLRSIGYQLPLKGTKIEWAVLQLLSALQIRFHFQKRFKISGQLVIPDFFLPDFNIVIECDGEYWHGRVSQKRRDHIKNQLYKSLGFHVIRLKEKDIIVNPVQALLAQL